MRRILSSILLIDDDEATNFLNQLRVRQAEITTHIKVVYDGLEAIEYLTQKGRYANSEEQFVKPELIFLDINMPIMDGWEFLENYELLSRAEKAEIVIVMLTTSVNPDDEIRAKKSPEVADFQHKPLNVKNLHAIFDKHFLK